MAIDKSKTQLSLFDTIVKIEKSTSSVDELRVPIFAPISKLSGNSTMAKSFAENGKRTVKTSWGSAEIRNVLLTQLHKDLLDCIMTHSIATKRLEKGGVALYFYLNDILTHYGDKGKNTNWLKEKLDDLADVRLKYYRTDESVDDDDMSDFRIFSKSAYSAKEKMYCVILDDTYVKLFETGVSLDYRDELPRLLQLKSPVLKAIIRFFFSHNHSNMSLAQLFETIGYPEQSKRSQQLIRKELSENVEMFHSFGIVYDPQKQMFYYHGNENVTFLYPKEK